MAPKRTGRTTIRDVATEAQVSIGTVSLALSDYPNVADETKRRVREAAVRLGYRANAAGQALRAGRMNAIGLVIPQTGQHVFSHLYFMEVLAGMSQMLNEAGMTLVLSTTSAETDEDAAYVKILRSQMVDGVVLASAAMEDAYIDVLQNSAYPFVLIGRYPNNTAVHAIGIDDHASARTATEHLVHHGHTRIAHIGGPAGHLSAIDRRNGYAAALQARDIEVRAEYVAEGDYSEAAGRAGMQSLLQLQEPPTALFAGNDETALGAIAVLRDAGIEPGADFPIVGFDDDRIAPHITPSLTTIRQPMQQLGLEAARMLLALLEGTSPERTQHELATELVIRQSCGCHDGREVTVK